MTDAEWMDRSNSCLFVRNLSSFIRRIPPCRAKGGQIGETRLNFRGHGAVQKHLTLWFESIFDAAYIYFCTKVIDK